MALHTTLHLHNVPPGREQSYAAWYDGKHRESLAALRGFTGAERYQVTSEQVMPDIPQPWRFLSVYDFDLPNAAIDIPALGPLLAEARDAGLIADDIAMAPRSKAGSFARTVHFFRKISGSNFWRRGIAYAGDLSAYPDRR